MRSLDALYQLITQPANAVRLRSATIAGSTATSATIDLAGGSVSGVKFLASYTPTVGDTVLLLQTNNGVLVILGKTA